jgi:hypothetical protein
MVFGVHQNSNSVLYATTYHDTSRTTKGITDASMVSKVIFAM